MVSSSLGSADSFFESAASNHFLSIGKAAESERDSARRALEFGHFTCIGSHEERVNCVPRGFLPKSSSALSPADSAAR